MSVFEAVLAQSKYIKISWIKALLITFLIMGVYLFIATRTTLWDRDETYYARVAVEMTESGNYLIPTFNGRPWLEKPVLLYWLMSLSIRVFGPTEFACRFFSVVGTALTCLLTFFIGRRLLGPKAGLWAMVILASTSMMLCIGGSATADAVLLPFLVAVMAIFIQARNSARHIWQAVLMGIALGFSLLAKGPIGGLPILVIAVTLCLDRKVKPHLKRYLWQLSAALVIGFLFFLTWFIPVNNATQGEFLDVFIRQHVLNRAIRPMQEHGGNFLLFLPYYPLVIIIGFFPWSLYLPGAFSAVIAGRVGGLFCRNLLISWIVPILVVMTLAATKLPHYVLFIWPALTFAVAGTIVAAERNTLNDRDRIWLRRGIWFFVPSVIIMVSALVIMPWFFDIPALRLSTLAATGVLTVTAIIVVREHCADRIKAGVKVLLVGMLVLQIPLLFGVLPAIEQIKISPAIAQAIKDKTTKNVPVATYGFGEPSLNFYIGRQIEPLQSEEAVVAWTQQPRPGVLIIPRDILISIQQHHGNLALNEFDSKRGFNYSKGTFLDVVALIRMTKDL